MPFIEKITVYPIKSLDGVDLNESQISQSGALYLDRAFSLRNREGRTVNAKKYPAIQQLRTSYDLAEMKVNMLVSGETYSFHLLDDMPKIEAFFSDYFKDQFTLAKDLSGGFPDDDENSGPTIVSTRTLETLQEWFPELSLYNLRLRFRANIELGGCPEPFWEDRLFTQPGVDRNFELGNVKFYGRQPCARCAVPARDPLSGKNDKDFIKKFTSLRQKHFPSFANEARFDHFYRLCVNTIIPGSEVHKTLKLGDLFSE